MFIQNAHLAKTYGLLARFFVATENIFELSFQQFSYCDISFSEAFPVELFFWREKKKE